MTTLSRRTMMAGAIALPALFVGRPAQAVDPLAPSCIRWPHYAERANAIMTPAELAIRYRSKPKALRYALRRLARYQVAAIGRIPPSAIESIQQPAQPHEQRGGNRGGR